MLRRLPIPSVAKALAKSVLLPPLRALRSSGWVEPLPLEKIKPGRLVVTGFHDEVMGLGRGAMLMIDAFRHLGLDPISAPIRPILNRYPGGGCVLPGENAGVWMVIANAPESDVCLQALRPEAFAGRYRIAYWAWETTLAPASWVKTAQWFHEIWTPSRFVAVALANCFDKAGHGALKARLRVQPHPWPRIAAASDRQRFNLIEGAFIALTMFDGRSSFARKNPAGVIEAWIRAFPQPAPDRLLLVKTLPASLDQPEWPALQTPIERRSDIRVIADKLDDEGMEALLASIDLLISLHRSEGFGLPIFEALSLGKSVLTTDYSAPSEFISAESAFLVAAREVDVSDPSGTYRFGAWGEPDLTETALRLREIAERPDLRAVRVLAAQRTSERLDRWWSQAAIDAMPWRSLI